MIAIREKFIVCALFQRLAALTASQRLMERWLGEPRIVSGTRLALLGQISEHLAHSFQISRIDHEHRRARNGIEAECCRTPPNQMLYPFVLDEVRHAGGVQDCLDVGQHRGVRNTQAWSPLLFRDVRTGPIGHRRHKDGATCRAVRHAFYEFCWDAQLNCVLAFLVRAPHERQCTSAVTTEPSGSRALAMPSRFRQRPGLYHSKCLDFAQALSIGTCRSRAMKMVRLFSYGMQCAHECTPAGVTSPYALE